MGDEDAALANTSVGQLKRTSDTKEVNASGISVSLYISSTSSGMSGPNEDSFSRTTLSKSSDVHIDNMGGADLGRSGPNSAS